MSNLANYSPYNKTAMFIHFQNTAYHQRNKLNAKPLVNSNLIHSHSRKKNPQNHDYNFQSPRNLVSSNRSVCSSLFSPKKQIQGVMLNQSRRVIHKNLSYQKFKNKRINRQNIQMVNRIINTPCQIINKNQTQKNFYNHLKYQEIRRRYHQNGVRKNSLALGKSQHLCPTLFQFNQSGLVQRYEKDLAISIKPSTSSSMRKSAHSKFS